ncbi:alanine:cation symporter family protein [Eggerthellaceae bacterium zg-1084]|uniref:alanine/glycine:cation symporter family protein n=1 Tax=Berryella wangjianweii TaxID=2734634 RepID=UPI00155313AE|nr:amino acid carrier protein [Berryella wangjianweii]NPD31344.1 alanine:cation symporter family protein [Berryella wangjianweii]NPD32347.1 alanine:cation symporter family protein [Eggerthellaceae bacterium zg-997]
MDALIAVTDVINTYMYTYLLVFLLIIAGAYFSIRTRFVQFRYFKDMFSALTEKRHVDGSDAVSSFQALMVSTASRVGTGNIAGVATAIAMGGPGAVFWMWAMSIVGAASAFVESTLAQIWKVRGEEGEFRGGPAYYIQQALGKRWLGVVFACSLVLCFAVGFNGLQAFNLSSSFEYFIPGFRGSMAAFGLAVILTMFTAVIIFGGVKRVGVLSSVIVPMMAVVYLGFAVVLTIINIADVPAVMSLIFSSAFDFQSIFGGFAGSVVVIGIKRGLFSNEAGMGSAPNAAAAASVSHPAKQGLVQTLSVFIDTAIICTCSAMIILLFYVNGNPGDLNGMPLVQAAVEHAVGPVGIYVITFSIVAFAFSSIIGNYFYAESNIKFIKNNKVVLFVFRVGCCIAVFFGAQSNFTLAWNLSDILMGIEAIINIFAILLLGKWAMAALDDYAEQKRKGLDPVFTADSIPGLPACECWHVKREELEHMERIKAAEAAHKVAEGILRD